MRKVRHSYEHAMYYLSPGRRRYWEFMISNKKKSRVTEPMEPVRDSFGVLMRIAKHLHSLGHRVIWVDITPRDIDRLGIKVVKVNVTGFQPLYFGNENRLNLGRLNKVKSCLAISTCNILTK